MCVISIFEAEASHDMSSNDGRIGGQLQTMDMDSEKRLHNFPLERDPPESGRAQIACSFAAMKIEQTGRLVYNGRRRWDLWIVGLHDTDLRNIKQCKNGPKINE